MARLWNLSLVAVTVALCLAAAEFTIRKIYQKEVVVPPGGNHPRFLVMEDHDLGYSLRPGFRGTMINPHGDFEIPVRIDSLGNREGPALTEAPRLCILGLGDSFTYGEGVPADSTYLAQLQRRLAEISPVRVVNAGVPGYSAQQMLGHLRRLASRVQPDIILLGLVPSAGDRLDDPFTHCHGYIVRSSYAPRLMSVGDELYESAGCTGSMRTLDAQAQAVSHLYRRVRSVFVRSHSPLSLAPSDSRRAQNSERWSEAFAALLAQFRSYSESIGARLLVVLVDSSPTTEMVTENACAELQLPCLRTALPLRRTSRSNGRSLTFPHDDHWTSAAHEFVASLIEEELLRLGWVTAASPPAHPSP